MDRMGELAEVLDMGTDATGSSRVTVGGITSGAEPICDCRPGVDEKHRRGAAVRVRVLRKDVDDDAFIFVATTRACRCRISLSDWHEDSAHNRMKAAAAREETFEPDIFREALR
jgi:hypothetical protein